MEYHIIPSTLCHDTVSCYKTIKWDVSDGLQNYLTGWGQRVKGSFVPKHSLKCNSSATSPQRHLNQSGRKHTRIKELNKMHSTIQSYLSRPRKKKNLSAIYSEVIHTKHTPTRYKLSFKGKDKEDKASLMLYTQWKKKKDDMISFERHNAVGTTMLGITRPNHTLKTDCTECIM